MGLCRTHFTAVVKIEERDFTHPTAAVVPRLIARAPSRVVLMVNHCPKTAWLATTTSGDRLKGYFLPRVVVGRLHLKGNSSSKRVTVFAPRNTLPSIVSRSENELARREFDAHLAHKTPNLNEDGYWL